MKKIIRDNTHGDILFDEQIFIDIINTPEMQRLRRILQLGGTQFAYPNASHTRFSHCIGVYHIISCFFENKHFKEKISEYDKKIAKITGLIHDIGHGPFSHTFEKITNRSHEEYTEDFIKKNTNINKILIKYNIDPNDVIAVLTGKYKNNIINQIISSQIDADRFDYLIRDSYNCGVEYAVPDLKWIINNAEIKDNKIVFSSKSVYAIESYLLGRYHMYKQVYNHKISIIFDCMFELWFKRVITLYNENYNFKNKKLIKIFFPIFKNETFELKDYCKLDDYYMFTLFEFFKTESDPILSDLSRRLADRDLFTNIKKQNPDLNYINNIYNKLKTANLDINYYFAKTKIKNFVLYKDGIKDNKDETIYIKTENKIKKLSQVSYLVNKMSKLDEEEKIYKYYIPKELLLNEEVDYDK